MGRSAVMELAARGVDAIVTYHKRQMLLSLIRDGGRIVNVSSDRARAIVPGGFAYA